MNWMKSVYTCSFILSGVAIAVSTAVADPNLKILSPADGAVVQAGHDVPVEYEIRPKPGGDHSHIYIDHKEAGILRRKKATFILNPLPAGEHVICLKVVNKAHTPIGQETCIKVISQ